MNGDGILSGNKDVDILTLSYLNDEDLFRFCSNESKNKYVYRLCSDENFWQKRFINKYGYMKVGDEIREIKIIKDPQRTWKNFYLKVSYYVDKYERKTFSEEELLRESSDIVNVFKKYAGTVALKKIISRFDGPNFSFKVYTETEKNEDILYFSKRGDEYYLTSENPMKKFTKDELILFLEELMYFNQIRTISITFRIEDHYYINYHIDRKVYNDFKKDLDYNYKHFIPPL